MRYGKFDDLLKLARKLASHAEGLTLDEIAAEMGTTRRTAERMRAMLEKMFPQWHTSADGRKKRFHIPGGLDSFILMPTPEEMAALCTAITMLEKRGDTSKAALLDTLHSKIRATLRPSVLSRMASAPAWTGATEVLGMEAGLGLTDDPAVLETIRTAIRTGRALMFLYPNGSGRIRHVTPWGLLYGKATYLVGPREGEAEPVLWRLDRMQALALSDRPATVPPAQWNLQAYAARSFGIYQGPIHDVCLRFTPDAAPEAARTRFHPTQSLARQPDGALLVHYRAAGLWEQAFYLFSWGTRVEILVPSELRTELCRLLRAALDHHRHRPSA